MKSIIRYIASIWFWFEFFTISAILFPISLIIFLVTAPFDKRLFILHKYTCIWSNIVLTINPLWRIRVTGRNKIDPKKVYVMVSNHQSGADIIVLFLLWHHFKWVAKKSLFAFPFIGWNMWLNHYISVERGKGSSMRKMMSDAGRTLKAGNSIMIFPEGTRSKNGEIQPFKSGAFHLALDNKVPILPIVISGTSKAIRKGGFLINKNHDIHASVLDPIPYESFRNMDPKEITILVERLIKEGMK
ncbi:MAG: lysophospholipid acyltransferase family protein [Bacteroidales bacterium]|nr:lysophospholipid acyltransferase family protein [Bacteroidales bacterium]